MNPYATEVDKKRDLYYTLTYLIPFTGPLWVVFKLLEKLNPSAIIMP